MVIYVYSCQYVFIIFNYVGYFVNQEYMVNIGVLV